MNPREQAEFDRGWDFMECEYGDMDTEDALLLDERVEDFERGSYDEVDA